VTAVRDVVDTFGRTVRLPDDPQRLVSLVPSITETLFDFGRGEQVVALTDYCTEPAAGIAGKTTIGGTKNPDVAAIIDLQPDLVLAVAEENRRGDVDQLAAAGVPVYVFEPRTVRDGIDLLWRVAELLGCRTEVAGRIEAIEHDLADTEAVAAARPRVRVFCPIWKDPYMTINHDTYIHAMLTACGGDNVFADRQRRFPLAADLGRRPAADGERHEARDRRYPRLTLDEMAAHRPDVILLPDEPYPFSDVDLPDFAPFADVPAVRDGRVHLIDGKIVSWYGPRIGRSLRALRRLLHPGV
jgi:ABC-type Fe3+-hydroxamate transport system substrate-binding protein